MANEMQNNNYSFFFLLCSSAHYYVESYTIMSMEKGYFNSTKQTYGHIFSIYVAI